MDEGEGVMGTREGALGRAAAFFDEGGFKAELDRYLQGASVGRRHIAGDELDAAASTPNRKWASRERRQRRATRNTAPVLRAAASWGLSAFLPDSIPTTSSTSFAPVVAM